MNVDTKAVGAQHESAHAVARIALELPLHRVEIDEFGCGLTLGYAPDVERPISPTLKARVAMAGQAVEQRYLAMSDDELISHWANLVGDDDEHDVGLAGMDAAGGYHWAVGFVSLHWDSILTVAAGLRERHMLTGVEVRTLVGDLAYDERAVMVRGGTTAERLAMPWLRVWAELAVG